MKTNRRFLTAGLMLAMALTFSCTNTADDPTPIPGGSEVSAYYGWYGNGSATNYTISTATQLRGLFDIIRGEESDSIPSQDDFYGKTITLVANINLNDLNDEWWPMNYSPFNGIFDGNNKTISGHIDGRDGIFGVIGEYGTVKNIVFTNFSYNGDYGVLAYINKGTVQNVGVNGNVSGTYTPSGVVGQNYGIVENCYSTSIIDGDGWRNTGGVVGQNFGTIQNCYATGSVSGGWYVGGIAGGNDDGSIQNCVALNPSINAGSINEYILGRISDNYSSNTNSNYALNNMVMRSGYTVVPNVNGPDGEDITSAEWGDANWWQNTVGFSSEIWEFGAGLPTLKNMPTGTQNPAVR